MNIKPTPMSDHKSTQYGDELFVAKAKAGKTITILGNVLGAFPWQENGGIVDKPEHCHVMAFDAAAVVGACEFFIEECGAHKDIGKVNIYDLKPAISKAYASTDYNMEFPSTVMDVLRAINEKVAKGGVHVLLVSSLTTLAKGWVRSISGPALTTEKFGSGMQKSPMDRNKWNLFKQQMAEMQWQFKSTARHTLWEGHLGQRISEDANPATGKKDVWDTVQIDGETAETFPANVERPWEVVRETALSTHAKNTKLTKAYFNPFPKFNFHGVSTGRKATTVLSPKEYCLTKAFHALGLRTGHWGV